MLGMKDNTYRQPAITRAVEKKRKIVKMSLIVVILFMVCWLPYHVYFIIVFFLPGMQVDSPTHFLYCHSPTQPQHELELDLIMGRNPPI